MRPLTEELKKKGHTVHFVTNEIGAFCRHYSKPEYVARRVISVVRAALKTASYDVIYASKPSAALIGLLISIRTGIPFVFDQDDLEGLVTIDSRFWNTSTRLAKNANKLIVASHWLARLYDTIRSDTVYLPNSVNLDEFDPSKLVIQEDNTKRLLWVSPESWREEFRFVREALAKCPKANLTVMGRGAKELARIIPTLNSDLQDRIEIMEWVPVDQIPSVYARSDVALLPYPDDLWHRCKCPTKLLEFIAMGIPYVATVGEPAYMAQKLGCGILSDPMPDDFASRTAQLLSSLDRFRENARRAREYLVTSQNFHVLGSQLERVLVEAFQEHS